MALEPDPAAESRAAAHAWYALGAGRELAKDWEGACGAYRRAAECDPEEERAVFGEAAMLVRLKKPREALELAEGWLAGHPESVRALSWLGEFYSGTEERGRARELLERLTALEPGEERNWMLLGAVVAGEAGDSAEDDAAVRAVEEVLERGIAAAPPAPGLHRLLARIHLARASVLEEDRPEDARASLETATVHLRTAAEADPGDGSPWEALGSLFMQMDRPEEALECYGKAAELRPDDSGLQEKMMLVRFRLSNPEGEDGVPAGAAGGEDDAESCIRRGRLCLRNRMPEEAEALFRRATELDPSDPEGWLCLAALQFRGERDPEGAAATLEAALEWHPDDADMLGMLGSFELARGKFAEAVRLFERVAAQGGENGWPESVGESFCVNFALALTRVRRLDEAAKWVKTGMEANPELLMRYVVLAMDRYPATRTQRRNVVSVLRRVDRATGSQIAALPLAQAMLLLDGGDMEGAVRAYRKAMATMEKYPLEKAENESPLVHYGYAVALEECGRREESVAELRKALELDPDHAPALNQLAYVWAEDGVNLEQALEYSLRSLAVEENAAFLDTLGWIHYKLGNVAEACAALRKADRMRRGDPTIEQHLRLAEEKAAELGIELPAEEPDGEEDEGEDDGALEGEDGGDGTGMDESGFGFPEAEEELLNGF